MVMENPPFRTGSETCLGNPLPCTSLMFQASSVPPVPPVRIATQVSGDHSLSDGLRTSALRSGTWRFLGSPAARLVFFVAK